MADIDLKTATPDTTIADDAILFGADSQLASVPSVYPVSVVRAHIIGDGSVDVAADKTLTVSNSLTLAGTDDKVLTVSNSLTLAGTDSTTMTFPSTSATIARTDASNSFTGNQNFTDGITLAYAGKTATYGISATDYFIDCTANTFTVTLPTAASVAGKVYTIKNSGTGVITVATTSAQTIDGAASFILNVQYQSLSVISDGSNWKVM